MGRPNIGDRGRFLARLNDILDRRWLTNRGGYVIELERRIAALTGVRNCVLVANGTIGLELLVRALGLTGEVIVPAFTFVATAHALKWQEITPVFADIDPATHSLDPASVEAAITPRTTGIIGVHLWGRPCAVDELAGIAPTARFEAGVRRGPRLRLLARRADDRLVRRGRDLQLSRDQDREHVRGRRDRHERRRAGGEAAAHAELRVPRLRQRDLPRDERQAVGSRRGDGAHQSRKPGRADRVQPRELPGLRPAPGRRPGGQDLPLRRAASLQLPVMW